MKVVKKIVLTLLFPVLMFVAMSIITSASPQCIINGKNIFLGVGLMTSVIKNTCLSICVALAIWLQFKNGRFDFSGGASMILAAIAGGVIGQKAGSPVVALIICLIMGILLCAVTGLVYVVSKIPIIICTIGMTFLYESLTYITFGGNGVRGFFSNPKLSVFGQLPGVLIPAAVAIIVFVFYNYFSLSGKRSKILANNQACGVNVGIKESKDVIISYIFTGIIIGMAAIIYVSRGDIEAQSGLSTSGVLFSYIVPVFMGMFIGMASCDVVGIIMAAIGMEIMNYGLACMNLGAGGWQQIVFGIFVLGFYVFSSQSQKISAYVKQKKLLKKLNA